MAGRRYSAGAIFLQVVPVFANVQRAIEDEAKNIDRALGDQMEKSGEKAGERAGRAASKKMQEELAKSSGQFERDFHKNVDGINRALEGIDTKKLGNNLRREVSEIKKELAALKDLDLTAEPDFRRAYAEIAVLEGRLRGVRDNAKIVFRADIDNALKGFAKVEAAKEAIEDPVEIKVSADFKVAERQMTSFEKSFKKIAQKAAGHLGGSVRPELKRIKDDLKALENLRIGVDISSNRAQVELRDLMNDLERISREDADVDVRVDAGRAFAELKAFDAALDRIDGRNVTAHVDSSGVRRSKIDADQAANSFRSFNIILLAVAGAGPALIPILGAIAGGLLAIGPAAAVAGAGLASALIGFSGIGDALKALQAREDQAAMTAQTMGNAVQTAGRQQADAARAVADARRAASKAIEDALDRQREAQEAYKESVEEVREAEKALREARREAAGTGDDIKDRIKDNELARDQALLDVFNATVTYDSTMADGSATNAEKEQARIDLEQARRRLEELREEQKELAKEKRKWDKEGVNGTEEVKTAQDRLNDAIDRQRDAYEALGEAAEAVDEARAEGARRVADAMRAQNQAVIDGADALQKLSSQQNAVNNAFNSLSPAGRKFALFLWGLRDDFKDFRDDIQAAMLPSIQDAIEGFIGSKNAGTLRGALVTLAASFGKFVKALSASFQGEAWGAFFEMLAEYGPAISKAYGGAFISFLEAMASIMTTLAPFALRFAEGFERMMDSFAAWAASSAGQEALTGFMDHIAEIAPAVLDAFGALAMAFVNLAVALAPYGEMILGLLTGFLDFIAGMDPQLLGAIAGGLLAIITASQLAYAAMNLTLAGTALLTRGFGVYMFLLVGVGLALYKLYQEHKTLATVLGIVAGIVFGVIAAIKIYRLTMIAWAAITAGAALAQTALGVAMLSVSWPIVALVAAIALLVAGIVWLWKNNEDFRNFVLKAWDKITDAFSEAWDVIGEVVDAIGEAVMWLWKRAVKPALNFIGDIFRAVFKAIKWYWDNWLGPVLRTAGKIIWWLWKSQIKVALTLIGGLFKTVFWAIKNLWKNVLKPTWDAIASAAKWLWKNALKPTFEWIGRRWDDLMRGMKRVWESVLEPVFDWIGKKALPKLEGAFDAAVRGIRSIWNGLKKIVGTPIAFIIDTVLNNGLIKGYNKVAGWVNDKLKVDPIDMPSGLEQYAATGGIFGRRSDVAYADGGTLPGYTPGRDVHHFYSPTGGRLHLSGGEAIMRPEFTAAVGPRWVDMMNAAARSGGVNAIRKMFAGGDQAYWLGGVIPLAGARVSPHTSGYSGYAADLNVGSGYDDYGMPVRAWKSGIIAAMKYIGDASYGRWVDINHGTNYSRYAHLSAFAAGLRVGQQVSQGTMIGRVGDLGNTGTPPTSHLHFEINGGTQGIDFNDGKPGKISKWGNHDKPPSWILDIVKNPLGYVKGLIEKPLDLFRDKFPAGNLVKAVGSIPGKFVEGVKDKVWDILPGWVKEGAGVVGKVVNKTGDVLSDVGGGVKDILSGDNPFAQGGIYNGTMKYDNGGYLPPGLTTVVNLTGKPEPVFTNDQWSKIEGSEGAGSIHYEPHFEGSGLTAEDVAADMNFTFRRLRRGGKYVGVGAQ